MSVVQDVPVHPENIPEFISKTLKSHYYKMEQMDFMFIQDMGTSYFLYISFPEVPEVS